MNDEISTIIKELIQNFVDHPQDAMHSAELQKLVLEFKALPMAFNFDCYAIKASGEIIVFELDSPSEFEVEKNPRIVNTILFQGIKKYPELRELMPIRSADDIECSQCDGTGIEPMAKDLNLTDSIICWCGGLGWIPKNSS